MIKTPNHESASPIELAMGGDILVPIDLSDLTGAVLAEARRYAETFNARIWLIHVAPPERGFVGHEVGYKPIADSISKRLRRKHQKLRHYQDMLRGQGYRVKAMLLPGKPAKRIAEEAQRLKPYLMIVGSHDHGKIHRLLKGSTSEDIIVRVEEGTGCRIIVVHGKTTGYR